MSSTCNCPPTLARHSICPVNSISRTSSFAGASVAAHKVFQSAKPSRFSPKAGPPNSVDPLWLVKTSLAVMAIGLLCAYLTVCGLFYVQQWQLVLHPSRTLTQTPAGEGLAFEPVRFGADTSGQPQLAGWWIPSDLPSDPTVLMLHGETGSMSDALPAALALHNARLNVLLFDYRGYGNSGGKHPTEQRMRQDAESALFYLTETRGLSPASLVVYGTHLGASLAVALCQQHPQVPALILQSADGDTATRVGRDARTRIFPVNLLFHQRFPLADALHRLKTPKLLISFTNGLPPEEVQRAADPKLTAEFPSSAGATDMAKLIRRFLDTYVVHPSSLL